MDIQKQRQLLQDLLVEGKLDSISVQVIALNIFANSIGYEAVNGDIRKGFVKHWMQNVPKENGILSYKRTRFMSLIKMQEEHNTPFSTIFKRDYKVVSRVSLQYNKRTTNKLTTQLKWLKFIREE